MRVLKSLLILQFFAAGVNAQGESQTATFAGGCFWCMEPAFEGPAGVIGVSSGYSGGTGENPTYDDYAEKGHVEVVRVVFDPSKISYAQLLDIFWKQIDPTDASGQFCDRGPQYRSAVFYHSEEQRHLALKSKEGLQKSGRFSRPIVTEIIPASAFYPAEAYHQDYYKKHAFKYKVYRAHCGRDNYLKKVWGAEAGHKNGLTEK